MTKRNQYRTRFRLFILLLATTLLTSCSKHQGAPVLLSPQVVARSFVSPGDPARLQRALAKASRGEPITIGVIGGSITNGEGASPGHGYANLVANWWISQFPHCRIKLVNAGVNGTGSNYGCLRVQRDLLSSHPDFVIVEFGVNDHDDLAAAETYEGVVRQIASASEQPAILLLFLMHHDGTNAQKLQSEIGVRYQLPMISYRDALWPEIAAGRLQWHDITADIIHPNDRGHASIALFINSFLKQTLDRLPPQISELATLPAPQFTDLYAAPHLLGASQLRPVSNLGWISDVRQDCWTSDQPGSVIEFDCQGSVIDLLYARVSTKGGTVRVSVDGVAAPLCDAWFDASWPGFCQTDKVAHDLHSGMHRVKVELIDGQNVNSTGHEFRILGLAGIGN